MPARTHWKDDQDAQLRRLRSAGMSWAGIAEAMQLSRNTVLERGRRLGARRCLLPPVPDTEDADRPPRCPGHPETWGLLTRGTLLAGSAYPLPVFL